MNRSFARRGFQSIGLRIRGLARRPDMEAFQASNLTLRMTSLATLVVVILSEAKDLIGKP